MAPTNKEVANLKINTLKKKKYESLLEAGLINEDELYMVVDNNAKTEYGDLYGDIENQKDLDNSLYASRLHLKDMSNDVRGYAVVEALNTRPIEFNKSKFTKVGYPVIDEEGIASGFSNTDYFNILKLDKCDNIEIKTKFTTPLEVVEGGQSILCLSSGDNNEDTNSLYMAIVRAGTSLYIKHSSVHLVSESVSVYDIMPDTTYYLHIKCEDDNICYYISETGFDTSILSGATKITKPFYGTLYLGHNPQYTGKSFFKGSIDLKEFEVYANGELIFTGWDDFKREDTYTLPSEQVITIPYTLSKDGVRIVDVAHKHLVDQLYAETGKGNYIIIDETNKTFRLPTPDIYSLLEQKAAVITFRKWEEE